MAVQALCVQWPLSPSRLGTPLRQLPGAQEAVPRCPGSISRIHPGMVPCSSLVWRGSGSAEYGRQRTV